MKKIGIWLDKEKAHLVTLFNDKEHFRTLESELEDFRYTWRFSFKNEMGTTRRCSRQQVFGT